MRNSSLKKGHKFAKSGNSRNNENKKSTEDVHKLAQQFVENIAVDRINVDDKVLQNIPENIHLSYDNNNNNNNDSDNDSLITDLNQSDISDNQTTLTKILIDSITGENILQRNNITGLENRDEIETNKFIHLPASQPQPLTVDNKKSNTSSALQFNNYINNIDKNKHITQIAATDSNQYHQHNNQQIIQLELMNNLYRHHLNQISQRMSTFKQQPESESNVINKLLQLYHKNRNSNPNDNDTSNTTIATEHEDADPRYSNPAVWSSPKHSPYRYINSNRTTNISNHEKRGSEKRGSYSPIKSVMKDEDDDNFDFNVDSYL